MKKHLGVFLFAIAVMVMAMPAQAQQVVWQGFIPGDGRRVGPINLQAGVRYYVQAAGSMYFGRWSVNGRPLNNDACFEFTARPRPVPLPILKNNLGINYCAGYNLNHVYRSAPFRSNGQALYFRIFDTDYRDNRGGINVTVFKVTGSGTGGSGVLRLSCTQRHHQEGKCCCFTGAHTYRFQKRFVTTVTATFDTGKGRNCRSTVRFEVRKQGRWETLRSINAVSGRGGTDRNRMRVTVNVQGRISGFRIADDCRCCIDYSDIVVRYTGGGGGGGGGGTNQRCRDYARQAVAQNQANLSRGCGYTGNRWQSNYNNHYNWCRGASSSSAASEDRARRDGLTRCGTGANVRCRQYAQRAVEQNRANLSRGCGYTGNRWRSNFNNHYNWCRQASASAARNEDQVRVNKLAQCGGGTQARCRNYAQRAVQQNQSNLSRGCGYTGGRWQSNYNAHFNWCRGASSSAARNEDQARVNQLAQCGGGANQRCRNYAQRAVQQNQANLSRRCGYTGTRWQSNFNNHYNWCKGVSSSAARIEDQARTNLLANCRSGPAPGSVVRFNNPRSHGLPWDWCLSWATNCGKPAADDFCRKKGYRGSVRWGKRTFTSTWVVNSNRRCTGSCGGFTFVECRR